MSIFTNRRNQQVLWSVINQNERVTNAFVNDIERQTWFRDIIEYFDINSEPPRNVMELKELNKNVVQYMVQDIKRRQQDTLTDMTPITGQSYVTQEQSYEQREQEYRKLLEAPTPTNVPNFKEDTSSFDGSISVADIQRLEQERTKQTTEASQSNPVLNELIEFRKKTEEIQTDLRREIDSLKTQLQICLEYMKAGMESVTPPTQSTQSTQPTQPTQPTSPTTTTSPETILIDDIPIVAENKNRDEASIHIEDIIDVYDAHDVPEKEGVEHQFQL